MIAATSWWIQLQKLVNITHVPVDSHWPQNVQKCPQEEMKQWLDVLHHKVNEMVKQIEDQSDIIDKFQSTISAYSNLHAWSHCANQAHRIFDAKIVMQKIEWTTHVLFWTQTWGAICCQVGAYKRLYEEEVTAHRVSQLMTMGPIACLKQWMAQRYVFCVYFLVCVGNY
jgi:truncated hemoglobin YjbI